MGFNSQLLLRRTSFVGARMLLMEAHPSNHSNEPMGRDVLGTEAQGSRNFARGKKSHSHSERVKGIKDVVVNQSSCLSKHPACKLDCKKEGGEIAKTCHREKVTGVIYCWGRWRRRGQQRRRQLHRDFCTANMSRRGSKGKQQQQPPPPTPTDEVG